MGEFLLVGSIFFASANEPNQHTQTTGPQRLTQALSLLFIATIEDTDFAIAK
jgi:hypothetical protein